MPRWIAILNSNWFADRKFLLSCGYYAIIGLVIWWYFTKLDLEHLLSVKLSWPYIFLAWVIGLFARYWGAVSWLAIMRSLGAKEPSRLRFELIFVYSKAWLARYLPGFATWMLGKLYFASQLGVSKRKLAVSTLLEAGLQIVVVSTVSLALLVTDHRFGQAPTQLKVAVLSVILIGAICLIPRIFNQAFKFAYKLVRRSEFDAEHLPEARVIAVGTLFAASGAVLNGLWFFLVVKSVYPDLPLQDVPFIVGAFGLSGVTGMLAPFAPAGIGVREGVLLLLLGIAMPMETAFFIAVLSRLWTVAIDILFFLLSGLARGINSISHR